MHVAAWLCNHFRAAIAGSKGIVARPCGWQVQTSFPMSFPANSALDIQDGSFLSDRREKSGGQTDRQWGVVEARLYVVPLSMRATTCSGPERAAQLGSVSISPLGRYGDLLCARSLAPGRTHGTLRTNMHGVIMQMVPCTGVPGIASVSLLRSIAPAARNGRYN